MNCPLVSVIVPVYNVKNYVGKCLKSIINQDYRNLEIIVVNDGSTDGSEEICRQYEKTDDRVKVYDKLNGGLSDARNYGLKFAQGEIFCFIDSDDWIHRQMISIMFDVMNKENADIVTCDFCRDSAAEFEKEFEPDIEYIIMNKSEALINVYLPKVTACNKLYKREVFNDVNFPVGKYHEDQYVIHKLLYNCDKVVVISKPLYFYSERVGSISYDITEEKICDVMGAYDERLYFAINNNWYEVIDSVVQQYVKYCLLIYFRIKDSNSISDALADSVRKKAHSLGKKCHFSFEDKGLNVFSRSVFLYKIWLTKENLLREAKSKFGRH